jgi:DNA-binding protein H-NS
MTTYHDVKAKIAKLEDQARELLKKESAAVIAKIRSLMSEYGLTVQDLGLGITNVGKKMSAMTPSLPPKYRDPISGKTWSGKGKAPGWIVEATKKGTRDDFLIGKAPKVTVKKAAPAKKAVAAAPAATKKSPAKKALEATTPVASKKAPTAPKPARATKAASVKPTAKPVAKDAAKAAAKPAVKKAVVAKKVTPKANPAPKADATSPVVTAPSETGSST